MPISTISLALHRMVTKPFRQRKRRLSSAGPNNGVSASYASLLKFGSVNSQNANLLTLYADGIPARDKGLPRDHPVRSRGGGKDNEYTEQEND